MTNPAGRRRTSANPESRCFVLALTGVFCLLGALRTDVFPETPPALAFRAPSLLAEPTPPQVVAELHAALIQVIRRFEAKDAPGVLAYVSDQYRSGPVTKAVIRGQLVTMFQLYEEVRTRVRIDTVQMVGELAWVSSSGEILGLVPWLGSWMVLLKWERELEVARKEQGVWHLFGSQR